MFMACAAVLLISSIAVLVEAFRKKQEPKTNLIYIWATVWLAVFAALAIAKACMNSKGYCRNWRILRPHPQIARACSY